MNPLVSDPASSPTQQDVPEHDIPKRKIRPVKLKDLKVVPPGGEKSQKAFEIETGPDQFKLHMLLVAVAKRGGGKTTAVCHLLRVLAKENCLDRVFLIAPFSSYESDLPQFEGIPLDPADVFSPDDDECVDKVMDEIQKERRDYDRYWSQMSTYKDLQKALKKVRKDEDLYDVLDPMLLLRAYDQNVIDEPPQHKWNGQKPIMVVIANDAQNSGLMGRRKFLNLCIRHRHVGARQGDRFGVSIVICCQNYKAQQGALPKCIRENATVLLLFKTVSKELPWHTPPECLLRCSRTPTSRSLHASCSSCCLHWACRLYANPPLRCSAPSPAHPCDRSKTWRSSRA